MDTIRAHHMVYYRHIVLAVGKSWDFRGAFTEIERVEKVDLPPLLYEFLVYYLSLSL